MTTKLRGFYCHHAFARHTLPLQYRASSKRAFGQQRPAGFGGKLGVSKTSSVKSNIASSAPAHASKVKEGLLPQVEEAARGAAVRHLNNVQQAVCW